MKQANIVVMLGLMLMTAMAAGPMCAGDEPLGIVGQYKGVFDTPPGSVPTSMMPDGPLLGNGDVGVVLYGPSDKQVFHIGKNDFWTRTLGDASVITVGTVSIGIPELAKGSYHQEQDLALAEVRGVFTNGEVAVHSRSFVDAGSNLLVTELKSVGLTPVSVCVQQGVGNRLSPPVRVADNGLKANVGRELHGGGRWYFNGSIAGARVEGTVRTPEEIESQAKAGVKEQEAKVYDGKSVFEILDVSLVDKAVTVSAWIKIEGVGHDANYIISKGAWNQAYSLGLSGGCLRWSINGAFVQTETPLELKKWIHVAGTCNSSKMCLYVDGKLVKSLGDDAMGGTVDSKNGIMFFTRKADKLPGVSREVAVATRVLGGGDNGDFADGIKVTIKAGDVIYVVSAILSDLDDPDFTGVAKKKVLSLSINDVAALTVGHREWWKKFWVRSFIEIPDKEIEKRWYAAQYVIGSCSRAGKVAPGLWGNWITTDRPAWHGDFHLNYNFQAPYYIVYSSNHADLSAPFYRAMIESVPNGRAMAKRHGWKGIHFPVCIGPWGLFPENPDGDWGQRSDAAFAGLNFIWQYQYTQDREFLKTTAYPYLLEVADFWEDYLKFEGGRYVIYNDSIHEGSGPDFNPLLSLGLVRTLFKNLIVMSKDLGVDEGRRAKWQDIGEKISAFPLQERGGTTVFRYSEKGMAWCGGNTLGIHHIYPAGAIGLDSDPKLLDVCRNTIKAMARWHDNNGFSSWYTACARVGYDPNEILTNMRKECDHRSYRNLLLYYGGGGIENVAGFTAINEMLLQSHEGVLRFFPCWPREQDARFGTLRAVGAFLVSAELKGGIVSGVNVTSEKGSDCTIQNPWPGKTVRVIRNGKPGETVSGPRFMLKTTINENIGLKGE